MKMGKEFFELVEVGRKAKYASIKIMVANEIETIAGYEYTYGGHKYNRAMKFANQFRMEAAELKKERDKR